jgi:hypothetical protein
MDDLVLIDLIDDISRRLIRVNDMWDRHACNEYVDIVFVPMMQDDTRSMAEYLIDNKDKLIKYIKAKDMQYGSKSLINTFSDLLNGLNRNNELYSIRKDKFKIYVQHFSKRAQDVRNQVHKVGYYTKQEDLEMGREGDWYEMLNEMCNYYLQFLKPYLVDQEQNKPQPEVEIKAIRHTKTLNQSQLEHLYNELATGGFIPDSTDKKHFDYVFGGGKKPDGYNGLEWCKNERLCVYMVDKLYTDIVTDWRVAHEFKIKNPAQQKVGYDNNKNRKPRGFELIDNILRIAGS